MEAEEQGRVMAYWSMVLVGASCLAPWLAYISAADYFIGEYPEAKLMYIFPIQNMSVLTFGSLLMMAFGEGISLHTRMIAPQIVLVFAMMVIPLIDLLHASHNVSLALTLVAQCLGACCVTVYQSSSYGAGGHLGPVFVNALETGKGLGGLGIVLARVATKLVLPNTKEGIAQSTNIFFAFSITLVLASVGMYRRLIGTPFAQRRFADYEEARKLKLVAASASNSRSQASLELPSRTIRNDGATTLAKARRANGGEAVHLLVDEPLRAQGGTLVCSGVMRSIASLAIIVCSTFVVCLGCFPGLTTSLKSRTMHLGDWFPVLLVLSYNTGDLIGKSLPNWLQVPGRCMLFNASTLVFPAVAHLAFVPAFLAIAHGFGSDGLVFVVVSALGLSTGYITCTAMMLGPSCVAESDRVIAGQAMSLFLMVGLFAGSLLGVALSFITGT